MIDFAIGHVWQSTLVAAAAALLTLAVTKERAQVRYCLWLAASLKFLVPFSPLVALGRQLGWRLPIELAAPVRLVVMTDAAAARVVTSDAGRELLASPIAGPGTIAAALPSALVALWTVGVLVMMFRWAAQWRRISAAARRGAAVHSGREVELLRRAERSCGAASSLPLVMADTLMEPSVFGIVRPLVFWPRAIGERLTDPEIEAIFRHEIIHVRRRDNLFAGLHAIVQSIFWFHPLVWWIGGRLIEERERACDEEVVRLGSEPEVYAQSILTTCRLFVESPLPCAAGVTGANLKKRIEQIMTHHPASFLTGWKKAVLASAAALAITVPIASGVLHPQRVGAQQPAPGAAALPSFEVASVKPNNSGDGRVMIGIQPGGRFTATNVPLRLLIRNAYQLQDFQLVGVPDWATSEHFDIAAKAEGDVPPPQPGSTGPFQLMMRSLLAERFKLAVHTEQRDMPIYALVVARNDGKLGPQLKPSTTDCAAMMAARRGGPPPAPPAPGERIQCGFRIGPGQMQGGGFPLSQLATTLSQFVGRVVVDKTGLTGNYDIEMKWTPDQMPQFPGGAPPPGAPPLPPIDPNGPSIYTALQEQLGLKLDAQRGPVDVLVIDHVERPTPD